MKVVIDTNIWISALITKGGKSREIIRLALEGVIAPQMSTALFLEYEAVMQRDKIKVLCPLNEDEIEVLFDAYLSVCTMNEIFYLWRPNLEDRNDDFLVELAVASNAEAILTGNRSDIETGELLFDFDIYNSHEFLERIAQ